MPPSGAAGLVPSWGWPDAAVALVLAVCLCASLVPAASRLRDRWPAWARGIDRVPVGLGLCLALAVTLLVRGHPDQQVLAGVTAAVLAAVSALVLRPRAGYPPSPGGSGNRVAGGDPALLVSWDELPGGPS